MLILTAALSSMRWLMCRRWLMPAAA